MPTCVSHKNHTKPTKSKKPSKTGKNSACPSVREVITTPSSNFKNSKISSSESSDKLETSSSAGSSPVNSQDSMVSPAPTTATKLQAQAANIDAVTDRLNRLTCLVGKLKNEIDHRQVSSKRFSKFSFFYEKNVLCEKIIIVVFPVIV